MRFLANAGSDVSVQVSKDELVMLSNALNEVCNGVHIDDWDFATRLGWDRDRLRKLLSEIKAIR